MKKEFIYLVIVSKGDWDDFYSFELFATKDKKYAEDYVKRLNSLIEKTKKYLVPFTEERNGVTSIKDEYLSSYQYSWWEKVHDLNETFIRKCEFR